MNIAKLSNNREFTVFKFGSYVIRFRAPYSLDHYVKVKEWDNGYLVVTAKYKHNSELEEEYIDLAPILNDLYIDSYKFLEQIKGVEVEYA